MNLRRTIASILFLATGLVTAIAQDTSSDQDLFPGFRRKNNRKAKTEVIAIEAATPEQVVLTDSTAREDSIPAITAVDKVNIRLFLPIENESEKARSANFDFYSGALMAVRELALRGINIDIDVHDCSNRHFAADSRIDFVIGPIRWHSLELALAELPDSTIVVSPLDPKADKLLAGHSHFVQIPQSTMSQWNECIRWAVENDPFHRDNYIIVSGEEDSDCRKYCDSLCRAAGIVPHFCLCKVQGEIENWETTVMEEACNKIILASSHEAVLNNAIRNMSIEKRPMKVFSGAMLHNYESIPVEDLHTAQVNVVCPQYVDYSDAATSDFVRKYRALYNTSPNHYAFQGYDTVMFMGESYSKMGKGWYYHIDTMEPVSLLQCNYKLEKKGGLVNVGMKRLQYTSDFKIIVAR